MSPPLLEHPDDDLALLRRGITEEGCARIVAKHGPLVMAACRRILRDEGLAEDAAQETFVLLIQKARTLSDGTPVAGWLYHTACRIAGHHLRTAIRRRARESSPETEANLMPTMPNEVWSEIEPYLDEAMLMLPERQRHLVVQCYFKEQPQRVAASAMGLSESVVSRELSAAIETLRRFFAKRGLTISGTALIALLSANAAQGAGIAASAAVLAAMLASTATTTSTALITTLLAMKMKLALAVAAVLLVSAVGYDLASTNSRLQAWWSHRTPLASASAITNEAVAPTKPTTVAKSEKAVAAARSVWEGIGRFADAKAFADMKRRVMLEPDADKRFALLQQMGVKLSRKAFDDIFNYQGHRAVADWRATFDALRNKTDTFDLYFRSWIQEDPLAALSWAASQPGESGEMVQWMVCAASTKHLDADFWREWMRGLHDPDHVRMAERVLLSLTDLPALIEQIGTGGDDQLLIGLALFRQGDQPDLVPLVHKIQNLSGHLCTVMDWCLKNGVDGAVIDAAIKQMERSSDPGVRTGLVSILRASRGEPAADYPSLLDYAATYVKKGGIDFKQHLLKGWAATHPEAAIRYAASRPGLSDLDAVLHHMPNLPDEPTLLSWLDGANPDTRDNALYGLYMRTTEWPFGTLDKIMQSESITDQVKAARYVMMSLPLSDAKAATDWIARLPPGDNRKELARELVNSLAGVDPQAALDFANREGYGDREAGISPPVVQFAAKHDLAQATQFIQQITDPIMYGKALAEVAKVKFVGRPYQAIEYLKANAHGNWQPAALRMFTDHYYGNNNPATIAANATEVLRLDLQQLGPYTIERANIMGEIWAKKAKMDEPLNWTLQFPAALGTGARAKLAANPTLKPPMLKQFQSWLQTAAITETERGALIATLNARLKK